MKKEKKFNFDIWNCLSDGFEFAFSIFPIIFIGGIFVLSLIILYNSQCLTDEKECYSFYKENGYLLERCEPFKDKLEDLNNE